MKLKSGEQSYQIWNIRLELFSATSLPPELHFKFQFSTTKEPGNKEEPRPHLNPESSAQPRQSSLINKQEKLETEEHQNINEQLHPQPQEQEQSYAQLHSKI